MPDLLLELFCEEIPARMQRPAEEALSQRLAESLQQARLHYSGIESFATPRRLAFRVSGLPDQQPDQTIERKGPKTDAPEKALDGFLRSTGLQKDQLEIRTVGKHECYFAVMEEQGKPTEEALLPILETLIASYSWPKSMRWGAHDANWVRPLQNICCILDREVIPVTYGPIRANNRTYGHRFMDPAAITLSSPSAYEELLESAFVIANRERRQQMILEQMQETAENYHLSLMEDPALLSEVTGLVEWPVVLGGEIDAKYMDLPHEVLRSEMRNHQKYFALADAEGEMADKFLITSNLKAQDGGGSIIEGNERVLRARLEDGRFYWDQDRKKALSEWAAGLKKMVFHAKLGTMAYRVSRLEGLVSHLCQFIAGAEEKSALRAAELAKADLTTGMVGEFPELQGVMGRYYALDQEEDEAVADAIRDHYLPLGPDSSCPTAPLSVAVALADKLDTLAGLFAIGEKPTGSKDPFALRRAALGVIRILRENELRLPLHRLLLNAVEGYLNLEGKTGSSRDIADELLAFFYERFKVMLKDQGIRHDIIQAVMKDPKEDDFTLLTRRVTALQHFMHQPDAANLLAAFERAHNIVQIESKKANDNFAAEPDSELLHQEEEKNLHTKLQAVSEEIRQKLEAEDYQAAFAAAGSLRGPMDAFFDKVTVNAENPNLRTNRLCLLAKVSRELHQLADFSVIEAA